MESVHLIVLLVGLVLLLDCVRAGFTRYGFANAQTGGYGGVFGSGHGGSGFNTYGTNVYYGGGVGGGYGYGH